MPEPERRNEDEATKQTPSAPTSEDSAGTDDDAFEDAETAREAKEEASKLDAIPYERVKKDEGA